MSSLLTVSPSFLFCGYIALYYKLRQVVTVILPTQPVKQTITKATETLSASRLNKRLPEILQGACADTGASVCNNTVKEEELM